MDEIKNNLRDPKVVLRVQLESFDHTYAMSDDHRYFSAGTSAARRLNILKEVLGEDEYNLIKEGISNDQEVANS